MNTLKIVLNTRTPIWTGGIGGTTDRVHETGIIGSLRWWYEAIVRGLGGEACDPTTHTCPDKRGNICDACALFGTTGLKRGFQINWEPLHNEDENSRLKIKVRNNRGWYLKKGLSFNQLQGAFYPTRKLNWLDANDDLTQILNVILTLIEKHAALGAQTQQGYGVVKIIKQSTQLNPKQGIEAITHAQNRVKRRIDASNGLPSLEDFFFARIRFNKPADAKAFFDARTTGVNDPELNRYLSENIIPIAPIIRYHLRALIRENILFRGKPNAAARWMLMGVLNGTYHKPDFSKMIIEDNKRQGRSYRRLRCKTCNQVLPNTAEDVVQLRQQKSAIHVSHAYPIGDGWEFRLWGHIPSSLPGAISRNTVLRLLKNWLGISKSKSSTDWSSPIDGKLWSKNHCNLLPENPEVRWTEKSANETGTDYLVRLLTMEDIS